MVVEEGIQVVSPYASPTQAVSLVRLVLGMHFDELVNAGAHTHARGGGIEVPGYVPLYGNVEAGTPEYDEAYERYQTEGGVEGLAIRRDATTGAVSFATIHGHLPARLTDEEAGGLFRADSWTARLHFPAKHSADENQRLVVDTYQLPLTHVSLAALAQEVAPCPERMQAYQELHNNTFTRTDAQGRPIAAVAIGHTIYGRPGFMPKSAIPALNNVMNVFAVGVRDSLAWHRLPETAKV